LRNRKQHAAIVPPLASVTTPDWITSQELFGQSCLDSRRSFASSQQSLDRRTFWAASRFSGQTGLFRQSPTFHSRWVYRRFHYRNGTRLERDSPD